MPLAALLLSLLLASPLAAAAPELHYLRAEHTAVMRPAEQAMFLASCPAGLQILAGGYKLLASELPLRDLAMVESRPRPPLRQWAVTLLYEPQAPATATAGEVKVEVSAVCSGLEKQPPGPLSGQRF